MRPATLGVIAVALTAILLMPAPGALPGAEWRLLLLFAATIAGVLWHPYPIGVMVLMSLAFGSSAGLLTLQQALAGFSNSVTWIIVSAFMFSRAFIKTGLGRRIALIFIARLGSSSLRLGYALGLTDLVLAPVTASNTARTGGIIFPIARSLSQEFDSHPGPTARRIGGYLLLTAFQVNVITSAMFLTAMAANGLTAQLASQTAGVEISWELWFIAASVPGAVAVATIPYLIYRIFPPELKATPEAQSYARDQLIRLGPMNVSEKTLLGVFTLLAMTWATSRLHGVSTVAAALSAVVVLLVAEVLSWKDLTGEHAAWSTFIWFGGFVSLAEALGETSLIPALVNQAGNWFAGWSGMGTLMVVLVVYLYLHYGFASMTSQIIALYAAFLAIAVGAGAPPLLAALLLCFLSNLYASLTHYGDGAAPIYYGSGYIELKPWWTVGFAISLANLVIWLGLGLPWWRLLGIW